MNQVERLQQAISKLEASLRAPVKKGVPDHIAKASLGLTKEHIDELQIELQQLKNSTFAMKC